MVNNLRYKSQEVRMSVAIGLNFLITAVEVVGSILSGSLSLLSDALHNFSDAISLIASFIAIKLSSWRTTEERTFGYKRAEVLVALFNASVLVIVSFYLFKEAIHRFFNPQVINSQVMISIATIGFVANTISVLLLRKQAHKSLNIKSAYLHLFSDVLSSLSVIIGGIFIFFFKIYWIDALLTVGIGTYVLKEGYDIITQVMHILMQNVPKGIELRKIKKEIEQIAGIKNIHHLHVWAVTERDIYLDAHIDVINDLRVSESCVLKEKIEKLLKEKFSITHLTLQFEYDACRDNSLIKS